MEDLRDFTGPLHKGGLWMSMGWVACFLVLLGATFLNFQFSGSQIESIKSQIQSIRTNIDVLSARLDMLEANLARVSTKIGTQNQTSQKLSDRMDSLESRVVLLEHPPKKKSSRRP